MKQVYEIPNEVQFLKVWTYKGVIWSDICIIRNGVEFIYSDEKEDFIESTDEFIKDFEFSYFIA